LILWRKKFNIFSRTNERTINKKIMYETTFRIQQLIVFADSPGREQCDFLGEHSYRSLLATTCTCTVVNQCGRLAAYICQTDKRKTFLYFHDLINGRHVFFVCLCYARATQKPNECDFGSKLCKFSAKFIDRALVLWARHGRNVRQGCWERHGPNLVARAVVIIR
jgi:hypothetical protein